MMRKMRWRVAAVVAFLMGVPFVAEARADDTGEIIGGVFGLVAAILGAVGDS